MTVIVAARTGEGVVTMAADRQVTSGWVKETHTEPKLWTTGRWAAGGTGRMRTIQVIQHHTKWPRFRPDEGDIWEEWTVKVLVPALRSGMKDHGVIKSESGLETWEAGLILATGGLIVEISSDGCAFVDITGRAAIGSGAQEALGFLGDQGPWTEADVAEAARRAVMTAVGVGGQIDVVDTDTLTIRRAVASTAKRKGNRQ